MLVLLLLSLAGGIITFIFAWGPFGGLAAVGMAVGMGALAILVGGLWFAYGAKHNERAAETADLADSRAEMGKNPHERLEPRTPPAV